MKRWALAWVVVSFGLAACNTGTSETTAQDGSAWPGGVPEDVHFVLPPDAIPAIWEPTYVSADRASLQPSYEVIGVHIDGEAKAYEIDLLDRHEIVNDTIGGLEVAITWCPLCGTAIVYDRMVDGRELNFGVSGLLYRNALVMYDRETRTLWSHFTGEGLSGPLEGEALTMVAAAPRITWEVWLEEHPDTKVLSVGGVTSVGRTAYAGYAEDESQLGVRPVGRLDERLSPKTVVVGVLHEGAAKAYPVQELHEERFVIDEVGGDRVVVYSNPDLSLVGAARLEPGVQVRAIEGRSLVLDNGTRVSMVADLLEPKEGVTFLPVVRSYWFAWADFHRDSDLWSP